MQRQTPRHRRAVGLLDRGVLAPGYRADVNVIDFDRLTLAAAGDASTTCPPAASASCRRADGYVATIVAGDETYADGEATGAAARAASSAAAGRTAARRRAR